MDNNEFIRTCYQIGGCAARLLTAPDLQAALAEMEHPLNAEWAEWIRQARIGLVQNGPVLTFACGEKAFVKRRPWGTDIWFYSQYDAAFMRQLESDHEI